MVQFQGSQSFAESRHVLSAKLTDMEFLVKCIPDVAKVNEIKESSASLVLRPGFSFVRGEMQLAIEKVEEKPGESAKLSLKTKGIGTSSDVQAAFQLAEKEGKTQLDWRIDIVHLGGLLKAVPQGLIQAAARKVIDDFMGRVTATINAA